MISLYQCVLDRFTFFSNLRDLIKERSWLHESEEQNRNGLNSVRCLTYPEPSSVFV